MCERICGVWQQVEAFLNTWSEVTNTTQSLDDLLPRPLPCRRAPASLAGDSAAHGLNSCFFPPWGESVRLRHCYTSVVR